MILLNEVEQIEFLRNLGEPYLGQLARLAQLTEREEGSVLFREGQTSPFIYIVLKGQVNLDIEEPGDGSVGVYAAGPGDLVGWSPVLGRRGMTATARAATRCRLAALEVDKVLELCEKDPRFGVAFLRQIALVLSDRLSNTRRCLGRPATSRGPLGVTPGYSD
jgi:CRP-like cAMP-binding protein